MSAQGGCPNARALELADVSFCYDGDGCAGGIAGVDLSLSPGECVVLTGPSGSGKSTCTRVINGLAPAYWPGSLSGSVTLGGIDAAGLPPWKRGMTVGSVFQEPASQFFSSELPGEVAFGCENYGFAHDAVVARVDAAIASFGLDALRSRALDVLSSGEKQRVAVASACAVEPPVVVCDEPTANLDAEGAAMLANQMMQLKGQGRAVLVSEHRLAWLAEIADRVVYLQGGRVLWNRPFSDVARMHEAERVQFGLRSLVPVDLPDLPAPQGPGEPALEARAVTCRFGHSEACSAMSLRVWPGQIVALTGRNGVGKSTFARAIAGLVRTSCGSVSLRGTPLRPAKRRMRVWYGANDTVSQFFTSSVTDELLLGCTKDAELIERAWRLLDELGLYAWKDAHPSALSGGQRQRLALACGILSGREVLVFDEPTSGLDATTMGIVADALVRAAEAGRAVIVITHDGELANRCCTHRVHMG